MPELRAYSQRELEDAILTVLQRDETLESRQKFRSKIYKDVDGRACGRLVKNWWDERNGITKDRELQVN